MEQATVYLIDSQPGVNRCVRALLDAGVDPEAIGIHRWDPLIAIRVRAAVPALAVARLARLGFAALEPDVGPAATPPAPIESMRPPRPRRRSLWRRGRGIVPPSVD